MLDLTDKQAEIIKVFLDNYRDDSNCISKGLSAKKLEQYGIEPKTFRNHRKYFLKNYFLRLSAVGYHGNRNYFYFQITRLGVIAYMKWLSKKESKLTLDRDFFPLLHKHWKKLYKLFDGMLFEIFHITVDRFEITPQLVGKAYGRTIYGGDLNETILVSVGSAEIKFFREYKAPALQDIPNDREWGETKYFASLNQDIDEKITERFSFLFYFNLLNLGVDQGWYFESHMPNYFNSLDNPEKTFADENQLIADIKSNYEKVIQNTDKLSLIIKKDKKLYSLISSSLEEISSTLKKQPNLKLLSKKLS